MNRSSSYIAELDGLRGVAILAVMVFHAGAPFMTGGFAGVDLFFVLSGYLITSLLVTEHARTGRIAFGKFYMRRILRLAPALLAMLAIFCAVSVAVANPEKAHRNLVDALIALGYLSNWARAFGVHPPDLIGHTWSLSIEEQFYLLWPLLFLGLMHTLKDRRQVAYVTLGLALASWAWRAYLLSAGTPLGRLYNGLDTRADGLMAGCVLGLLLPAARTMPQPPRWLAYGAPIAALGLLAYAVLGHFDSPGTYSIWFALIELLVVLVLTDVLLNRASLLSHVLRTRWLVWTGSISYGLYLWHYPIYRTLFALGCSGRFVLVVGSVATCCVAVLSYYGLEQPVLSLKTRFRAATVATHPIPAVVVGFAP